jgi:hypothetical protein
MSRRDNSDDKIIHLKERKVVSALAVLTSAMEEREHRHNGGSVVEARERLASNLGLAPGTVYNLARDRIKKVTELKATIARYAVADLEKEIAYCRHQMEMAHQVGAPPGSDVVIRIQTALRDCQELHALMTGAKK